MGWFSNIFKKGESKPKDENVQEVDLAQFIQALEGKISNRNSVVEDDLKKMHRQMVESSRNFASSLSDLKESPGPSAKVDNRIMDIVNSYRISMVKAFNKMFIEFGRPVTYSITDFDAYFTKCSSELAAAENNVVRFIKPLQEVFPGSMTILMNKSRNLSDTMADVKKGLEKTSLEVKPALNALKTARDLEEIMKRISETESRLQKEKTAVEGFESNKKIVEQKIVNFENSDDWKGLKDKEVELKKIEEKRDEIRAVVLQTIVPIDKGMKRLKKLISDSGEIVDYSDALETYIDDPVTAFLKDKDQSAIRKIILRVKALAENDSLAIDDQKTEKILDKISKMESENILVSLRSNYDQLEETEKKLREDLSSSEVGATKMRYNDELKENENGIEDSQNNIKEIEEELNELNEKKNDLFGSLRATEHEILKDGVRLKDI